MHLMYFGFTVLCSVLIFILWPSTIITRLCTILASMSLLYFGFAPNKYLTMCPYLHFSFASNKYFILCCARFYVLIIFQFVPNKYSALCHIWLHILLGSVSLLYFGFVVFGFVSYSALCHYFTLAFQISTYFQLLVKVISNYSTFSNSSTRLTEVNFSLIHK